VDRGEKPIELGDSWFYAKPMEVGRTEDKFSKVQGVERDISQNGTEFDLLCCRGERKRFTSLSSSTKN